MKLQINNIEFQQKKPSRWAGYSSRLISIWRRESLGNVYSCIYMIQENPASPVGFEFEVRGLLDAPKN